MKKLHRESILELEDKNNINPSENEKSKVTNPFDFEQRIKDLKTAIEDIKNSQPKANSKTTYSSEELKLIEEHKKLNNTNETLLDNLIATSEVPKSITYDKDGKRATS